MKSLVRSGVWLCSLLITLCFLTTISRAQAPADLRQQADAAYAEKSYARALELYRQAKAAGPVREPEEVDYRILVSLFKTEKWDEAISTANYALEKAAWKARIRYVRGQIYYRVPHFGYKVKDKIIRGRDFPEVEGAERPQQIQLYAEDQKQVLDDFETAKIEAQKERDLAQRARFFAPIYPMPWDQEIDLNFDLAAFLPTQEMDDFIQAMEAGKGGDENIDLTQGYNRESSLPKKVLYLYNEIGKLDQGEDKHDSALALYAKGTWVRGYRQSMDGWARKWDEKQQKEIVRPYPFDHLEALPIWQQLVEQFPKDPIADKVQLLVGQTLMQQGDLVKALAAYRALIQSFPNSRYVSDARSAIQQITRKSISFYFQERAIPGTKPKLQASATNVGTVNYAVYGVKLEDWLTKPERLQEYETSFTSFTNNFGAVDDAARKFGKPLATWTWQTGDKGDYKAVSKEMEVPVTDIGAYILVASAGPVRYAGLTVISDLALLRKADRDSAFIYVADARTGAPVTGASAILKERYNQNNTNKVSVAQGKSDDSGFFEKPLMRGREIYSSNVAGFAWVGNRYALTGQSYYGYYGNYGDNRDELRILSYTDRPVYRPEQKVYFRQILTSRVGGTDWKPSVGTKVKVQVTNPKGETVFNKDLTTGEFGTLNGDFMLPAGAPLGEWNVQAYVDATAQNVAASGASRFRVEEYKRPEFEVTVTAPKEAKRPGETVAARINAKYYFGSPVPNASVKYTVRRSVWWSSFHFPTAYDWLYQYWGVGDYDTGRRNIGGEGSGEIVKEGTVKTDAQGFAELTFETKPLDATQNQGNWWFRAYANPLYTIEAEVTDASRRTIEAQGQIRVADQQYFAFLNVERGYFRQNDRVPVELRTQDANDQPVQGMGKMVVYKLLPGNKEEKVFEEAVQTDAQGRTFWNYEAKDAGQFRIAYEATDAWNKPVRGETTIWVAGEGLNTTQIRLQGVTILLDKRYYAEEDTIRALLIADKPNATVLFTQETGGEILRRDVFKINGKSREIAIPVEKRHVPNFFLAAAMVQDFEVYQTQQEVFVPPVRQLINVSVSGDKSEYKPGEKGTLTVKATDWRGQPARAEVSLGLIDASLFYIQKDYTPDFRQYYYAERRGNAVNLDSSRSGNFENRAEDDSKYTNYENHGLELPDNLGQLNLPPGGGYWYGVRSRGGFGGGGGRFDSFDSRVTALEANGAAAVPMAAPAPQRAAKMAVAGGLLYDADAPAATTAPGGAAPQVRSNFAETAFWSPAVVTEGGQAKVEVTFPDSVTQWHATARGLTNTVQVGSGETDVVTRKDLIVRLQSPRFFVERDEVTLSANVHNYSKQSQRVRVHLTGLDGYVLKLAEGKSAEQTVEIKAGEEQRVDWNVAVLRDGNVAIQVTAQTATDSDGVKMNFPVLVHGVQRFAAQSGVQPRDGKITVNLNFPKERRQGASQLNLQLNPSMAAQMLDALPYLADYPYGCVEQTMSRFLPAALTARVLKESGINLATLRQRAQAYEAENKTQAVGDRVKNSGYSYPKGMPNSRDLDGMASRLWHTRRWSNPVYDEAELNRMVNEGLNRLYGMQRSDGGWGWWPGSGESDEYMSAYVVYGLAQAKAAEVPVRDDVLNRGYSYLEKQMTDEENLHLLTYIAYSLSQRGRLSDASGKVVSGRLFEQRERLTAYSKALLAMALWNNGDKDKAGVLVRNLENTVKVDAANGTARWGMGREWWCWWNNDVEANAVALRAFLQIDPRNKLVPMMMKWLTTQSRGGHWRSTKETAENVYALADYVRRNKELDVDYTLKVNLNGKLARTYRVTRDNVLFFDNRFIAGDIFLENGANTLTIEKTGKGNLYWSAYSEYFSLEEPIKASGNEIGITRRYFKLTRKPAAQPEPAPAAVTAPAPLRGGRRPFLPRPIPAPQAEFEYDRTEIKDGSTLKSGDLVEIELILDSKNDYSYLVFEDMKPAGLEPVDIRSGGSYSDGLCSNVELRDQKVAFFVDSLPQGKRVLRYRMRAEIPGRFHALPTNGYAMYAPEVRAISDEMRVNVTD